MPAKITLTITQGKFAGRKYVFIDRSTCVVGRDTDCHPRLPNDSDHSKVSRRHCLLDINPPDIRIRDFGSRNGTFVNGKKIGQRGTREDQARAARKRFRDHDLRHGDEVRLGSTIFKVGIYVPAVCAKCGKESAKPRTEQPSLPGVSFQCQACQKNAPATSAAPAARSERVCTHCGKDVSEEMGELRQGELICAECQSNPAMLAQSLLDLAHQRGKDVAAIKGYRIIRKLGQGAMGAVFHAKTQRGDGEDVALKLMLPQVALDDRCKELFLRETENARSLKHPNIVGLREAGCARGIFFLVMDYCEQGSAEQLLQKGGGRLAPDHAIPIMLQVLDGLEYAHHAQVPHAREDPAHGLVHRDLKPANILFADFFGLRMTRIGDFGLSKAFDRAGLSGLSYTGGRMGSPFFMPRLQVINCRYSHPDVDVWAAAACLYYLLTGAPPRDLPRDKDPFMVLLNTNPIPIRDRDTTIPRKLADVIDLALYEESGKPLYFQSAAAFKNAVQQAL